MVSAPGVVFQESPGAAPAETLRGDEPGMDRRGVVRTLGPLLGLEQAPSQEKARHIEDYRKRPPARPGGLRRGRSYGYTQQPVLGQARLQVPPGIAVQSLFF